MRKIKLGDYVETNWASTGVKAGEQGFVIDACEVRHIRVIFPARSDLWADTGWYALSKQLKVVCRF